ncbi:hypothetical protein [Nocardia sp. NPDC006630]|uniref:DUF7660 family protein n=1 Tax=Nocardia sp. NPDC006630 TaxID=3157181 RepID=UPI0033A32CC8
MPLSPDDEIQNRAEFAACVDDLRINLQDQRDRWNNATLESFLEALSAWVDASDGWYQNRGKELPRNGDWTFFARALTAAAVYE